MPHGGFETARVAPPGQAQLTAGGEASVTTGKRTVYQLKDGAGETTDASNQHQPYYPIEVALVGRYARGIVPRVELDASAWNPFILPPLGVGAAAGFKVQLVGGQSGPLALALGGRVGGFAHVFGAEDNQRSNLLGQVEARLVASYHPRDTIAVCVIPAYRYQAMRDRLSDNQDSDPGQYTATEQRAFGQLTIGLALGRASTWFIDLSAGFAPDSQSDPDFLQGTVGLARRELR